ncbi:MAG: GNAT family N-acetyltransferase [Comamonadaceae bacterium]|nr:GNAT family N-acetyltransferase [Comamonadaceae bacterium]
MPDGYRLRTFARATRLPGRGWNAPPGEFSQRGAALEHFAAEFGPHVAEMTERCLLLESDRDGIVGTTTAWRDPGFRGVDHGRIHWVAVTPAHQGRGLGRLLVTRALVVLRRWHVRAYLTTQTSSWIAIHLYLGLGFVPYLAAPEQAAGWDLLRREAPHPPRPSPYARADG